MSESAGCPSRLDVQVGWMSQSAGCPSRLDVQSAGCPVGWMSSRLDVQSAGCLLAGCPSRLDVRVGWMSVGWMSSRLEVQSAGCPVGWMSSRLDVHRLDVFRLDVNRLDVRKSYSVMWGEIFIEKSTLVKLRDSEIDWITLLLEHITAVHQSRGQGMMALGLPGFERCRAGGACPVSPTCA